MVLAGVLLKLGGYGLCRLSLFIIGSPLILKLVAISMLGGGFLGVLCCRVSDIKVIIAYSSVVHISLVICGLVGGLKAGLDGGV